MHRFCTRTRVSRGAISGSRRQTSMSQAVKGSSQKAPKPTYGSHSQWKCCFHELPHMLPKTWTIRKVKGQSHEASISCPSIIKIFLILLIHLPPQSRASRDDDVLLFVCLFVCLFECLFACRQRVMIDHWPVLAAGWRP